VSYIEPEDLAESDYAVLDLYLCDEEDCDGCQWCVPEGGDPGEEGDDDDGLV
jgi:hypothetical protein